LRQSGITRLSLPGVLGDAGPTDVFLEAVREVAAGEFEILGQMGRGKDLSIVYLARDLEDGGLVALRLEPGPGDEYLLDVVEQLDASIPSTGGSCPSCAVQVREWGRFCHQCGADLSGVAKSAGSKAELLEAVRDVARGEYEVLGEMSRAEGGGVVYFAREIASGKLVALRLEQEREEEYALGLTGVLEPLAARLGSDEAPAKQPVIPVIPEPKLAVTRPHQRVRQDLGRAGQRPGIQTRPPKPVAPPSGAGRAEGWPAFFEFLQQPLVLVALFLIAVILVLMVVLIAMLG
jgi:hypothetical protein